MKRKEYRYVIGYHDELNDVYYFVFKSELKVNLKIAEEIVENRIDFTNNKEYYLIIDVSKITSVNSEARSYLQHPENGAKNLLGSAFIASNPLSALIANIFVKTPNITPSKFFSNKEEALKWILELKAKNSAL
jgi:hypothetical protein